MIYSLSTLWTPDLRQTAQFLPQSLSFSQMFHTLLAGQRHCRQGCGCSVLLCLCAWRSYSTWRSGSSLGDLWEGLYMTVFLWQFLMQDHSFQEYVKVTKHNVWEEKTVKTYLHIHPCWKSLHIGMRFLHFCSTRSASCSNPKAYFLKQANKKS